MINYEESNSLNQSGKECNTIQNLAGIDSLPQKTDFLENEEEEESNDKLSERFLSEEEVMKMITLTQDLRDRVVLRVLYSGGVRLSELVLLKGEERAESDPVFISKRGGRLSLMALQTIVDQ